MYYTISTALLALSVGSALALNSSEIRRCGNVGLPPELLEVSKSMARETATAADRNLEVDAFFHVVATEAHSGWVTDQMLSDQLDVLNDNFGPHGISFNLVSSDYTVNNDWAKGSLDHEMKSQLRQGTYADLNLYFLTDLGNAVLGFCQFPGNFDAADDAFYTDGCSILAETIPGGEITYYNQGGSAVHEVGHWFGLIHVFQGESCTGDGDSVADTPPQKSATSGCPVSQDSCPDTAGLDSIHNFMDYSFDSCYTEFTAGQATRMYQMWDTYRAGVYDEGA